jgi:hypothetical protein
VRICLARGVSSTLGKPHGFRYSGIFWWLPRTEVPLVFWLSITMPFRWFGFLLLTGCLWLTVGAAVGADDSPLESAVKTPDEAPPAPRPASVQVVSATIKVENPKSTATALIVRKSPAEPRVWALLTARHVFDQATGDFMVAKCREPGPDGLLRRRDLPLRIRQDGQPLWKPHPQVDLAALPLNLPEDFTPESIDQTSIAGEADLETLDLAPGDALLSTGYPLANEGSPVGHPLTRRLSVATWPLLPSATYRDWFFDGNSHEGDSGGPVWFQPALSPEPGRDRFLIVGVVIGQRIFSEEHSGIMSRVTQRHRLGFAVVLPAPLAKETLALLWAGQ